MLSAKEQLRRIVFLGNMIMKLACTSFALHYSTGIASVDARKPVSIALHRALSKYLEEKRRDISRGNKTIVRHFRSLRKLHPEKGTSHANQRTVFPLARELCRGIKYTRSRRSSDLRQLKKFHLE